MSRRNKRLEYWKPKIKKALVESNNVRSDAAKFLNIKYSHLKKMMRETKNEIDWTKEYPSPFKTPFNT